jgi:hypothetical protein
MLSVIFLSIIKLCVVVVSHFYLYNSMKHHFMIKPLIGRQNKERSLPILVNRWQQGSQEVVLNSNL